MTLIDRLNRWLGRDAWDAPLICVCATPRPDAIGECAACRRLVLREEAT